MNARQFVALLGKQYRRFSVLYADIYDNFSGDNNALANGLYTIFRGKRTVANAANFSPEITDGVLEYNSNATFIAHINYGDSNNEAVNIVDSGQCFALTVTPANAVSFSPYWGYGVSLSAAPTNADERAAWRAPLNGSGNFALIHRLPLPAIQVANYNDLITSRHYIVSKGTGNYWIMKQSGATRIVWINDLAMPVTTAFPYFYTRLSEGTADNIIFNRLASAWRGTDVLGTSLGALANGASITIEADGWIKIIWTPSAGETLNYILRETDSDNYIVIRFASSAAASNANTIKIIKREAASESELASISYTMTTSTAYMLKISAYAAEIAAWGATSTGASTSNPPAKSTSATFNQTVPNARVTGSSGISEATKYPALITGVLKTQLEIGAL